MNARTQIILDPPAIVPIPKRIWSFWDGPPCRTVDVCVRSWREHNPGYEINVLSKSNLHEYLGSDFVLPKHAGDSVARFSDYVRLELLARHGGIWIDASILCNAPFDWIHAAAAGGGADMVGFYLNGFTNHSVQSPVIESWFFACTPGSSFVTQWRDEFFHTALYDSIEAYVRRKREVDGVDTQGIHHCLLNYLCIHVAAQACLQQRRSSPSDQSLGKICLFRAEDGPLRYLCDRHWNSAAAVDNLLNDYDRYRTSPIIKMRSGERQQMDRAEHDARVATLFP